MASFEKLSKESKEEAVERGKRSLKRYDARTEDQKEKDQTRYEKKLRDPRSKKWFKHPWAE